MAPCPSRRPDVFVYLRGDIPNQIIVTWDQVSYYNFHTGAPASLQLVLRGPGYAVPSDEGQIDFLRRSA